MSGLYAVYGILYFIVFVFGIAVGSFLNVCIYRIPLGISVVGGSSFCPHCKNSLKTIDLVPLFSYFFLTGKCRFCKQKISPRYPAIELLTGILFMVPFAVFGFSIKSILLCLFFSALVVVAFIDWDTGIIPDSLVIFIAVLCPFSIFLQPGMYSLPEHIVGFFIVSIPMLLLALLLGGFGGGDIKLMAVCGLFMGGRLILLAMTAAVFFASAYGIFLIMRRKANKHTEIPFGPFLSIGMMFSACIGVSFLSWYMSLM